MVSMNIVITGGSGFVGSYLCERLINDGHNLIVVDNLLTGSTENISDLMDNDNFSFIEHDVQNPYKYIWVLKMMLIIPMILY